MVVGGHDRPPLASFRGEPQSARIPPPTAAAAANVTRACPPPISQRGRPRGAASVASSSSGSSASSSHGVASFMENAFSPFVRCWQPPVLASCMGQEGCGAAFPTTACDPLPIACGRACSPTPPGVGVVTPRQGPPHTPPPPPCIRTAPLQHRPSPSSTSSSVPQSPLYNHSQQQSPLYDNLQQQSPHHHHHHHLQTPIQPVKDIENPHENDVLCGRGGSSNRHNCSFRELVAANKANYATLTKKQKMLMARRIVELVHNADPPGRFLARDAATCLWYDIGLPRSLEKTSQALRENASGGCPAMDEADAELAESENVNPRPSPPSKRNPRSVETPVIIIPPHLESIYRRDYPPRLQQQQQQQQQASPSAWPTDFYHCSTGGSSHHREPPYTPNIHDSPFRQRQYPSGFEVDDLPAPHRGSFPFHAKHTPREDFFARFHPTNNNTTSYPHHHAPPSPVYSQASSAASVDFDINPINNSILASAPSFSPSRYGHSSTSGSGHNNASSRYRHYVHPPSVPNVYDSPQPCDYYTAEPTPGQRDGKRQRTNVDSICSFGAVDEDEVGGIERTLSEDHRSQQLSVAVESKLTLQEKVIGRPAVRGAHIIASPSGILQSRHSGIRGMSATSGTSSNNTSMNDSLNISANSTDGLAGLAALSTAAFLRLDETD